MVQPVSFQRLQSLRRPGERLGNVGTPEQVENPQVFVYAYFDGVYTVFSH